MGRRSSTDSTHEPFPDRIVDDAGVSFAMGLIGGSIYHFAKGMSSSPNGHRLADGVQIARMNGPRVGGSFAVWGGLFSASDCAMVYLRQKEDPWNSIAAGAILSIRQGVGRAAAGALFGGAILALMEGFAILNAKHLQQSFVNAPSMMPPDIAGLPEWTVGSGESDTNSDESLFGRWREKLGLKRGEKGNVDSAETKVLERFDDEPTPTPMPTFEYK